MVTRERTPALRPQDPESSQYIHDRYRLLSEARSLFENDPIISGVVRKFGVYIAGRVRYQANTGDVERDRRVESYIEEWSEKCDLSQRFSFPELVQMAVRSQKRDGDIGAIPVVVGSALRIQLIESDRIGNPDSSSLKENDFAGVRIDAETGEPIE